MIFLLLCQSQWHNSIGSSHLWETAVNHRSPPTTTTTGRSSSKCLSPSQVSSKFGSLGQVVSLVTGSKSSTKSVLQMVQNLFNERLGRRVSYWNGINLHLIFLTLAVLEVSKVTHMLVFIYFGVNSFTLICTSSSCHHSVDSNKELIFIVMHSTCTSEDSGNDTQSNFSHFRWLNGSPSMADEHILTCV